MNAAFPSGQNVDGIQLFNESTYIKKIKYACTNAENIYIPVIYTSQVLAMFRFSDSIALLMVVESGILLQLATCKHEDR